MNWSPGETFILGMILGIVLCLFVVCTIQIPGVSI